jgi:hypothetical protein
MAQGARSRRLNRKGHLRGCPFVPPSTKRRGFTMQANRSANSSDCYAVSADSVA